MQYIKLIAAIAGMTCIAAIAIIAVLRWPRPSKVADQRDSWSLIDTITVEKVPEYAEDPDEEGECGDTFPLEDAEGLFDTNRSQEDRQALIDIMKRQGITVKAG